MKKIAFLLIALCAGLIPIIATAQTGGADAKVVCKDATHATEKVKVVYQILNQKAKSLASVSVTCDQNTSLSSFSGQVTDASGNVVKKIKKGDLKRTEYSDGAFATDCYTYYYDYAPPTYPITVTYEWTQDYKDNLLGFTPFLPQPGLRLEVEHAKYELTAPDDMGVRYKVVNMPQTVKETKQPDGFTTYTVEVSHLSAIPDEDFREPIINLLPAVLFAPSQFSYWGTTGNCATWESFGKWQYSLLEGRDQLSDATKAQLHAMTDTCTSTRSKIAVVYKFLEQTTRYVSIQLGIGGLQPFPASEVCRTGFGDCKGLTNYMRAMLGELGIRSIYATINSGSRKNFYPDFSSAGQSNHVVLCVPEATDSLWIECTNATLPLGYVHSDIAGHNAMAVDEQGGHLVRLPEYADTLNLQTSKVDVALAADGSAKITFEQCSEWEQYEHLIPLRYADEKKRREWLLREVKAPQATVEAIKVDECRTPYMSPKMNVEASLASGKYASITGSRMFVPLNPTHRTYSSVASSPNRKGNVYVASGYRDVDIITIHVPEGYAVEALPAGVTLQEAFGQFKLATAKTDEKTVVVNVSLTMHQGTYPPSTFKALYEFKKKVLQQYGQKMVLKRL